MVDTSKKQKLRIGVFVFVTSFLIAWVISSKERPLNLLLVTKVIAGIVSIAFVNIIVDKLRNVVIRDIANCLLSFLIGFGLVLVFVQNGFQLSKNVPLGIVCGILLAAVNFADRRRALNSCQTKPLL